MYIQLCNSTNKVPIDPYYALIFPYQAHSVAWQSYRYNRREDSWKNGTVDSMGLALAIQHHIQQCRKDYFAMRRPL